jgi:hypothetical protein
MRDVQMDQLQRLLEYVNQKLTKKLGTTQLGNEYYYHSLPLAAIDAVYSAQALYPSVQNVVKRYCAKYQLPEFRKPKDVLPPPEVQEPISSLLEKIKLKGTTYFIEQVFLNSAVTSGRRKAEVLFDLLSVLDRLHIQNFQHMQEWLNNPLQQARLINAVTAIHGVGEATYRYFLMLSGDDQMVKPDRMIMRFIKNATGKSVSESEAVGLIQAVSRRLLPQYPFLSPRLMDYIIWSWQREQDDQENPLLKEVKSMDFEVKATPRPAITASRAASSNVTKSSEMTLPQKTQYSMFRRYQPGQLLSSAQIKEDVLEDFAGTPRGSVLPSDYCCNRWNKDPRSGIYHVFYYDQAADKFRLLPKLDVAAPRKRGDCP